MMTLLHVSYDIVRKFRPRVPKARLTGEDGTIPRICVAPTIEDCINSKCGKASTLIFAKDHNIPVVLYVYEFDRQEYIARETLFSPFRIKRDFGVADAALTFEHWLLAPPISVKRRTLLVESFELEPIDPDTPYPRVKSIRTREVQRRPAKSLQGCAKTINRKIGRHLKTDQIFTLLYEDAQEKAKKKLEE